MLLVELHSFNKVRLFGATWSSPTPMEHPVNLVMLLYIIFGKYREPFTAFNYC